MVEGGVVTVTVEVGGEEVMVTSGMDRENNPGRGQNTLRLAACSDLRKGILTRLGEDKKPLSELREELDVSSTTAIHALRELERDNLVFQDEARNYALTQIGEVIALKLSDFIDAIEVLKKHEDFWLMHDLSGIPPHLLDKIGDLKNSILLEDTPTDIFKAHATFLQILDTANEVKGISSIFHPGYPEIIEKLVIRKGIDVELILTDNVLAKTFEVAEGVFKKLLRKPNFTPLVINEDVKIALTITDTVFNLGLFTNEGVYDYNRDLICYEKKGLLWGGALYNYYRQLSKKVDC